MLENFLTQDLAGNWNTIPPTTKAQQDDINCHKFVLYAAGQISFNELISDSKLQKATGGDFTFGNKALEISNKEFVLMKDYETLKDFLNKECKLETVYIGQILDAKTGELAHSFLIVKLGDNVFKCADKPGFKYPFGVRTLEELFEFTNKDGEKSYYNQKWRIQSTIPSGLCL